MFLFIICPERCPTPKRKPTPVFGTICYFFKHTKDSPQIWGPNEDACSCWMSCPSPTRLCKPTLEPAGSSWMKPLGDQGQSEENLLVERQCEARVHMPLGIRIHESCGPIVQALSTPPMMGPKTASSSSDWHPSSASLPVPRLPM